MIKVAVPVTIPDGNGCPSIDSVLISVIECDISDIFIPTAFSPNGDGKNDVLYPRGTSCMNQISFLIYDRWGELVFESASPDLGWDGFFKGKLMNPAVFVYYLSGTFPNGQSINRGGNITLLK